MNPFSIQPSNMLKNKSQREFVEKVGVEVVPRSAFSELGESYIRTSCAYSTKTLKQALDRIKSFFLQK